MYKRQSRLDPDSPNSFDCLSEGIVLSREKEYDLEIIAEDVVARFDDRLIEATIGDKLTIHEAGATFLILKGWARFSDK